MAFNARWLRAGSRIISWTRPAERSLRFDRSGNSGSLLETGELSEKSRLDPSERLLPAVKPNSFSDSYVAQRIEKDRVRLG